MCHLVMWREDETSVEPPPRPDGGILRLPPITWYFALNGREHRPRADGLSRRRERGCAGPDRRFFSGPVVAGSAVFLGWSFFARRGWGGKRSKRSEDRVSVIGRLGRAANGGVISGGHALWARPPIGRRGARATRNGAWVWASY